MTDDVSTLAIRPDAPGQAIIIRPRTLPTTAQFAIETQLAWKLRNARGFLPNHFMIGDENERAAKILAAIEYARAVGIEPMIALQNTQIIEGKVGASALLIGALLRKAGYTITDDTNDERSVVTVSKNGSSVQGEFSMQDAARAKLVRDGSGWQKYPRDMMYARALTQAARRGAQDAVLGMAYTAEELGGVEEELAGVADLRVAGERDQEPGAPEASAGNQTIPTGAAIQPAPPAPPAEPTDVPDAGQAGGQTPPPPQAAPVSVMPLSGPALARRMGAGRSIGPAARRTNTVTVEPQGATAGKVADEPAPPPVAQADPIPRQPAAPDLLDEADLPPAQPPAPVDDGLGPQRDLLRRSAAELHRVNVVVENVKAALEGKEQKPLPPKEPNAEADAALAKRIDADRPGRSLANLGAEDLDGLLTRFESSLAKKREQMKERGIQEE